VFSDGPSYDVAEDEQVLSSLFSPCGADAALFTFCSSISSADTIDSQNGTSGPNFRTVSFLLVACIGVEDEGARDSGCSVLEMSTLDPILQSGAISN
jgi:hypothetical protein